MGRVVGQPLAASELEETVQPSGQAASRGSLRHADRQLDAVVALFEAAARFTDRLPAAGLEVFLERPAEPGDSG